MSFEMTASRKGGPVERKTEIFTSQKSTSNGFRKMLSKPHP